MYNNQLKSSTVSAHKNTVAPLISSIQGVQQTKDMQGSLGGAQGVYQQCNYYGTQQCYCPNPCSIQTKYVNPVVNQTNQQIQHQAAQNNYRQTQQIGYTPNTFNQYVTIPNRLMQPGQYLNPTISQTYPTVAKQSYVSGVNSAIASNQRYVPGTNSSASYKSITNSYKVQQATMQYPGYNQNHLQNRHQVTQMNYLQNNMLRKSVNVTPKHGYVYSNQVDPTQTTQSNLIATSQIQSFQHNLQQNSYSGPLNTQQQTNSIAQQSLLNYNYQPSSKNVQRNRAVSFNSHSLPHHHLNTNPNPLETADGRIQSSLPQTSRQKDSTQPQHMKPHSST